jgi:mycofactocin precursor
MDKPISAAAATAAMSAVPVPAGDDTVLGDGELIEEDLLVEDVSIDGMCGVY